MRREGNHESHPSLGLADKAVHWLFTGTVLLTSIVLFIVDLETAFGRLLSKWAPTLRSWAIVAGMCLSVLAMVQGHRVPAVVFHEVSLPGLPTSLDGRVVVALSDTHVGTHLVEQIEVDENRITVVAKKAYRVMA